MAHQESWWFYFYTDLRIAKEVQTIEVYKHEVRRDPRPCLLNSPSSSVLTSSLLSRSAQGPTMGAGLDVWPLTQTGW